VRSDIENYIDFRIAPAGYRGPKIFQSERNQGLFERVPRYAPGQYPVGQACSRPSIRSHAVTQAEAKSRGATPSFHRPDRRKIRMARPARRGRVLGWGNTYGLSAGRSAIAPSPRRPRSPAANPRSAAKAEMPIVRLSPSANATRRHSNEAWKTLTLPQPLPPERGELAEDALPQPGVAPERA